MRCKKGFEIEVLMSPNGYYLGTRNEIEMPNCRISYYYPRQTLAEKALKEHFAVRNKLENRACSGGNCFEWQIEFTCEICGYKSDKILDFCKTEEAGKMYFCKKCCEKDIEVEK